MLIPFSKYHIQIFKNVAFSLLAHTIRKCCLRIADLDNTSKCGNAIRVHVVVIDSVTSGGDRGRGGRGVC